MKTAIITAAVLCLALIGAGIYFTVKENQGGGVRIVPLSAAYEKRKTEGGWSRGKEGATVTVIEYADFQCPACGAFNPIINQAYQQTKDTVTFQFRNYPLTRIHDKAHRSAIIAEAAGRQGKFWDMAQLLYGHQREWEAQSESEFITTATGYAQSLSLNMDQFKSDTKDSSILENINKDIDAGDAVPVQGTPTIVINGKALSVIPKDADALVQLITKASNGS